MKRYAVVIEKADGNYSAYVPDLPGCVATAATVEAIGSEIRAPCASTSTACRPTASKSPIRPASPNTSRREALLCALGSRLRGNDVRWKRVPRHKRHPRGGGGPGHIAAWAWKVAGQERQA